MAVVAATPLVGAHRRYSHAVVGFLLLVFTLCAVVEICATWRSTIDFVPRSSKASPEPTHTPMHVMKAQHQNRLIKAKIADGGDLSLRDIAQLASTVDVLISEHLSEATSPAAQPL